MVRLFTEKKYKREVLRRMIITFLIVILAFFSGGLSFYYSGQRGNAQSEINYIFKKNSGNGSYDQGYKAALDFARKKVQEKGMFFPGGQMTGIPNGTVKSVSGNSIVVEFDASVLDFFAEGKLTKTVTIPDSVSIQQFVPRPMEEYQKEERLFRAKMDDYNTKREAGETVDYGNIQPPMPYNIKKLEVKDLKAGDVISVTSAVDVSKLDTFEATSVNLAFAQNSADNIGVSVPAENPEGANL